MDLRTLQWDSEFFGVKVARLTAGGQDLESPAAILDAFAAHGAECVYWLVEGGDWRAARTAEACGFRLTDVRMTFERLVIRESELR